ncbi:MAG: hypothetical protein V4614_02710 [Pseudomonadota bacterium]
MKTLLPTALASLVSVFLLCGCPDTKMPKAPPKIPEPKASLLKNVSPPDLPGDMAGIA